MSDDSEHHLQIADWLMARYSRDGRAPDGWREALAWHLEQAHEFDRASRVALDIAERCVSRLDFFAARQWARRMLELLERLGPQHHPPHELRAYALTLAVLEFGGQYREGLDYARRMLRLARERDNPAALAGALLACGRMQRELGQLTLAESTLNQARSLTADNDLEELDADVRLHLAKVYQLQGRHDEALLELRQVEDEPLVQDDQARLARVLTGIGDTYRLLGAISEALVFYNRAISIEQGRGSLRGQAILREKLALAYLAQTKHEAARNAANESLRLRQMTSDVVGQARSMSVLGSIAEELGQYEQALTFHEQARDLDEQTQNWRGEGIALVHLGDTARALKRFDLARQHYQRALALARQVEDRVAIARSLERIGDLSSQEGQIAAAETAWREALGIRETLGHEREMIGLRQRLRMGVPPRI